MAVREEVQKNGLWGRAWAHGCTCDSMWPMHKANACTCNSMWPAAMLSVLRAVCACTCVGLRMWCAHEGRAAGPPKHAYLNKIKQQHPCTHTHKRTCAGTNPQANTPAHTLARTHTCIYTGACAHARRQAHVGTRAHSPAQQQPVPHARIIRAVCKAEVVHGRQVVQDVASEGGRQRGLVRRVRQEAHTAHLCTHARAHLCVLCVLVCLCVWVSG